MCAVYYYDPKHIFSNIDCYFSDDMRVQAKAYIKENENTAGIIIGSSMLENTSSYEASRLFYNNKKKVFLNLSLRGSSFAERKIILDYAFKNRKLEKVIYSLDPAPLHFAPLSQMSWQKVYDDNPINDITLYFNNKSLQCLLSGSHSTKCYGVKTNLDRPPAWITDPKYFGSFNGICSWTIQSKVLLKNSLVSYKKETAIDSYDLDYQKKYVNNNIFNMLDEHRSTVFYFLIPPYSALYYKIKFSSDYDQIIWGRKFLRYFISECDRRENCKVYGFNDLSFTIDLKNYKDPMHYSDKINSYMLNSIKENRNILNSYKLDLYFERLNELNSKVSLNSVKKQLDECL